MLEKFKKLHDLQLLQAKINEYFWDFPPVPPVGYGRQCNRWKSPGRPG
jgi:hypothetical protein